MRTDTDDLQNKATFRGVNNQDSTEMVPEKSVTMKKKTLVQELKELCIDIVRERNQWKHINDYGCSDPFWPDGCNMNLTRNHIIYDRRQIKEICEKNNLNFPEEYYLPVPPEVSDYYMANLNQKERVERIKQFGSKVTTRKVEFPDEQMSFI